jgi:hypothetical protein
VNSLGWTTNAIAAGELVESNLRQFLSILPLFGDILFLSLTSVWTFTPTKRFLVL